MLFVLSLSVFLTVGMYYAEKTKAVMEMDALRTHLDRGPFGLKIKEAVIKGDNHELTRVLRTLRRVRQIENATVFSADGIRLARLKSDVVSDSEYQFTLDLHKENEVLPFYGWVQIHLDERLLNRNIAQRVGVYFLGLLIKTTLICLVVVLIFYQMLTKHVLKIAFFVKNRDYNSAMTTKKLDLKRSPDEFDEIDALVKVLNDLDEKVVQLNIKHKQEKDKLNLEKKLAYSKMMHSAKLASIGEVVVEVSHEIKNPLSIINGYNDMMKEFIEKGEREKRLY